MNEKPILFSGPMVRAILDGRKTQTRRVVLKVDSEPFDFEKLENGRAYFRANRGKKRGEMLPPMPYFHAKNNYGEVGDRLWVRETFELVSLFHCDEGFECDRYAGPIPKCNERPTNIGVFYEADGKQSEEQKFHPSIHMPRWASRITLEITGVRAERLQEISEQDAKSEGAPMWVPGHGEVTTEEVNSDPGFSNYISYRLGFEMLWQSINAKRGFGWETNPWVWVITFKRSTPD